MPLRGGRRWCAAAVVLGLAGCSDTVDVFDSTGSPGSGSSSGAGPSGSDAGSGTGSEPGEPCSALDLLLVVDTTPTNAQVRRRIDDFAPLFVSLLADPQRPWSGDFRVGVVSTNGGGTAADCRIAGAMSTQPDPAVAACEVAVPWASSGETDPAATLACLGTLPEASVGPRDVALATARGLGLVVAEDPEAAAVVEACNAGFVREQSFAVALVLTSGDDEGSPGDPTQWASWFESLVASPGRFAVAALLPTSGGAGCTDPAVRLESWLGEPASSLVLDWCTVSEGNLSTITTVIDQLELLCEG